MPGERYLLCTLARGALACCVFSCAAASHHWIRAKAVAQLRALYREEQLQTNHGTTVRDPALHSLQGIMC